MTQKRKILVTSALPYANGDIHLGHLVEYLQTDFWVRFQKMRGHECLYMCADDTHGTPVMIAAKKKGITPQQLIEAAQKAHLEDFAAFEVAFDNFGSTNSDENRVWSERIFLAMEKAGHIENRSVRQAYCSHDQMFLPDRFVRGTCPKCGAEDQYGDSCDVCSATYSPTALKNPRCSVCGTPPEERESHHLFFRLEFFRDFLSEWVPAHTQGEMARKLSEWFAEELRDWDISREAPYFGFEIPGHPGKYFYVWLDAPIGYISSTEQWCARNGRSTDEFWVSDDTEIYHFIGKDIVYFHCLFWPAMLRAAGLKTPNQVFVHGFLKVNGEKMSKSKGTFIDARTFRKHIDPLALRYYYACKLSENVEDIDLSFRDFVGRVNSDLVGKITNVASRGFQMLQSRLDGKLGTLPEDGRALVEQAQAAGETIAGHYESRNFSRAMLAIRDIADAANKYFDEREPWKLIKEDPEGARGVLTTIINLFRIMAVYLKPILPSYVGSVEALFEEAPYTWDSAREVVEARTTAQFSHLAKRIDPKAADMIIDETKEAQTGGGKPAQTDSGESAQSGKKSAQAGKSDEAIAPAITLEDFKKVDMRIAKVLEASEVEGAKKLLQLKLDIGTEQRTVFAGIKSAYAPQDLVGRYVVMVANLEPRKMKFGVSQGMVMAVGDGDSVFVIAPDEGARPGQRVS